MMFGAPVNFLKKFKSRRWIEMLIFFLLELLDVIILAKVNTRFDSMY